MQTWLKLFYTIYISVELEYREIFCAEVGKGGISNISPIPFSVLVYFQNAFRKKLHLSACLLTLHTGYCFMLFCHLMTVFKLFFSKHSFRNTIRVSSDLAYWE